MSSQDLSLEAKLELVSSMLATIHLATAAEALSLGAKTGLDMQTLYSVITGAAGNSAMFEAVGGELLLGNSSSKLASLDSFVAQAANVLRTARSLKFPSPLTSLAEQILLSARGFSTPDSSAAVSLGKFFSTLGGGTIKSCSSLNEGGEAPPGSAGASDTSTPQKVAFLGLGAMGIGMASSILRAGIPVSGYDVWAPSLQKFVEAGGQAADSPQDACKDADVVVLMVVSIDQAKEVLLGKEDGKGEQEGVAHLLASGATVILSSTCPPSGTLLLSHRLAALANKPQLVDAPVSGGTLRAANGDLSIMASGDESALDKGRKVLEGLTGQGGGPDQRLFIIPGGVSFGSCAKMVNQHLASVHVAALAEAMAFAAKLDLPLRKVFDHVNASQGRSWMFNNRVPHMLEGDLHPYSAADILVKDIGIVIEEAAVFGSPAFMVSAAHYPFLYANGAGWGRDDDSGIVRIWEALGIKAHRKAEN